MTSAAAARATHTVDIPTIVRRAVVLGIIQAIIVGLFAIVTRMFDGPVEKILEGVLLVLGLGATVMLPGLWTRARNIDGIAAAAGIGLGATVVFLLIDVSILGELRVQAAGDIQRFIGPAQRVLRGTEFLEFAIAHPFANILGQRAPVTVVLAQLLADQPRVPHAVQVPLGFAEEGHRNRVAAAVVGERDVQRLVHIFEMRDGKISRELVFDMGRPRR